ncbi:4-hydroxy-tetrahydrodipicolinate reductase [Alicyclobacillaceae bacterium I2511]|nr:4-hydroxy-tetrahydrodipicolinate reductase [Alicyclobacillaceae bacterium I2511]
MEDISNPITIALAGATGKMGLSAAAAILGDPRFQLSAVLVHHQSANLQLPCPTYTNVDTLLTEIHPRVWLDFTDANSVGTHVDACLEYGVRPVIGTTGYTDTDLKQWHERYLAADLGGIVAPNFAIGALLMMRFAAEASRFFSHAEIIELHHVGKKDAPSGTARRTAETMAKAREQARSVTALPARLLEAELSPSDENLSTARGLSVAGIAVHSVRLPGLVAHQEVLLGGQGETLTVRHDTYDRQSFMPGVLLALDKVEQVRGIVYGLEHLLW